MKVLKNEVVNNRNKVTVDVNAVSYYRLGGAKPQWKKTKSNHILNKGKTILFEQKFSKLTITASAVTVTTNSKIKSKNSKEIDKRILEFLADKQKLQAVKFYKDETGLGLKESKDYVDALEAKKPVSIVESAKGTFKSTKELDKELMEYISKGALLAAVKIYKDATGMGLKESKDYVDALKDKIKK